MCFLHRLARSPAGPQGTSGPATRLPTRRPTTGASALLSTLLAAGLVGITPALGAAPRDAEPVVIEEHWLGTLEAADNVDSVATWHGPDGTHLLIATAKDTDLLQVFDAATGDPLRRIGGTGNALGRFLRPNGISVIDDLVVVVERDNRRVQVLSLPDFEPLGAFGAEQLQKPYGLWIEAREDDYRVFVTDAYELPGERTPPDAQLDRRLQMFSFSTGHAGAGFSASWLGAAGDTEGMGRLPKVESLFGDATHYRLLVADETESDAGRVLKVYNLDGGFAGEEVGRGVYLHEPEGIALYACDDGSGYWIGTDQHDDDNRFPVFDRETLDHVGSFAGAGVRNTDGIWLTRTAMPGLPRGAIYAVHDDGSVGAFRLEEVLDALDLDHCREDTNR